MTTETSPAKVLMDVLDRMDNKSFQAQVEAAERADGVRPPLWEIRYKLNHSTSGDSWLDELEHSFCHVMAAPTWAALRGALVQHAALTAAWIQDLDGREPE